MVFAIFLLYYVAILLKYFINLKKDYCYIFFSILNLDKIYYDFTILINRI